MSRRPVRLSKPMQRRRPGLKIVLGALTILFMALFAFSRLERTAGRSYFTAAGTVEETRIVVDHVWDSRYGGQIYYRIEAHVNYEVEGQAQDRWLTASEITPQRELLLTRLEPPPKTCQVYWAPKHPENARCRLK